MKKIIIPALAIILLGLISCGRSKDQIQKDKVKKIADEVMEIHDRSMAHHGDLFKQKKKLVKCYESEKDSIVLKEVQSVILDLEKADADMMNWMHQYKVPDQTTPADEQIAYYTDQKNKIESVETFSNSSLDHAKKLLEKCQ